jgi:FAD/FMN-containing dehydrogenase
MSRSELDSSWRTDVPARAVYSEGAGIARVIPRAVRVVESADELPGIVREARQERLHIIPRGSGSGMPGGAVGEGMILDLSRLNWVGAVDANRKRVSAGAGAVRNAVDAAARVVGLRFPVDPSSGAFCTVGGMASTNAAGPHTLRFGAMRDWVTALDCVFDDGTRAVVRRGAPPPDGIPAVERFLAGAPGAILAAPVSLL